MVSARPAAFSLQTVEEARERISGAVYYSPCSHSQTLSTITGCQAFFKLENLQMTGTFKDRGALSKLLALSPEQRSRGVIAASAGNHAQGIAYHSQRLGIAATIVMPEYAPIIKIANTRRAGANVVIHGANYDASYAHALELHGETGATFVHAFNDYDVMAGQGTIGLELLEQVPDMDAVVVPIGGGGLISGIATAIKEQRPDVRVIGVQSQSVPAMQRSLEQQEIVCVRPEGRTIADGIAVQAPGSLTFPVIQKYVDDIVSVNDEEIANSILMLLEIEKTVVEGAGAVPLAAVANRDLGLVGKKVVMVVSGGNIDVNMLALIIRRGLARDGRMVRLRVVIGDRPGALAGLSRVIADAAANVLQINHQRTFTAAALGETEVEIDLETEGSDHVCRIISALEENGYRVQRVD